MKKAQLFTLFLCLSAVMISVSCTQSGFSADTGTKEHSIKTLADENISRAKILVERDPKSVRNHLGLTAAYLEKVRETGDYSINRFAELSIKAALAIEPESFEAKLFQTQIFLSEHEFGKALEFSNELTKQRPDNPSAMAAKTDALTELGKYDEAVKAAQEFVDTRPNSVSYTRVAHLRSLFGDIAGAIEARMMAIRMADPYRIETFAWYHSELGKEYFNSGDFDNAEKAFEKALSILPEYHWALAGKGKVLAARGELGKAAKIYEGLRKRVPETSREIFLGDIYTRLGRIVDAERIYKETAVREKAKENGDLHRIALLWADHNSNLTEALEIAQNDRSVNNDLAASDTYAWALYKTGDYQGARKQIRQAMRLNSKNALFFFHFGMIENALGNKKEAVRNLELAISTNPSFDLLQAETAKQTLEQIQNRSSRR